MSQIPIKKICVCGAGTMGRGIAQVIAQHNFDTILYDVDREVLNTAHQVIEQNLQQLVEKGKIEAAEENAVISRLCFTNEITECKADVIIEAIVEKLDAKIDLFNRLALFNDAKVVFATNTSSLSVSKIAAAIANPERVIGLHFFNPATIMKLVEVVQGVQTGQRVIESAFLFIGQLNKAPVLCKDVPGFIVNRVARPYYLAALRLVEEGLADIETVDSLLESTGFKMGPFRLMDLIGNDINFAVSQSLYHQLGAPARLKPSALQEEKVRFNHLGRKSGEGYYRYRADR